MPGVRRPGPAIVLALFGAAAVVRVMSLMSTSQLPWFGHPDVDAAFYHEMGKAIAAGDWGLGTRALFMNPGYPYVVGATHWLFGELTWAVRIVQLALGLGVIALLWDAARRLWGPWWALLPTALAAFYGPFIFYESVLLATSVSTFAHTLLLWSVLRQLGSVTMETSPSTGTDGTEVRSPSAPVRARGLSWAAIGLVWGACVLLRPNALFLAIPLAWLAWRQRTGRSWRGLAHLAAFAVAMALVVIPITARNLVVTGEPVLLSANGGLNFHIGNRPGASGTFEVPPALAEAAADPDQQFAEFRQVAESDTGKELGPAATDLYWYERTWALIAQDPLGWLATLGEKLHLFFNGRELSNVYDYEFARKVNDVLAQPLVQLAWFAPLALLGTLLLLRRNDPRLRWIAGFNLTMALAVVVFFVVARYRLPAIGGFMLAATAAARELVSMARERRWRSAAATGLALLACAAFTYPVSVNKSFGDEYFKLGAKWHEQQLFHQAENAYQAAIRHNPDHLRSHHNLAVLYGGTLLDPEDARHHWKQVERIARERGNTKALEQARQGLRDGGQAL